jgi:hypothetical protein
VLPILCTSGLQVKAACLWCGFSGRVDGRPGSFSVLWVSPFSLFLYSILQVYKHLLGVLAGAIIKKNFALENLGRIMGHKEYRMAGRVRMLQSLIVLYSYRATPRHIRQCSAGAKVQ